MAVTVRELVAKLGFTVEEKGVNKFSEKLEKSKKSMKLLAGVAVAAAGTLFVLAKSAAAAGDDIAKTAPTVGLTTDEFQEYSHAVDLAGVSQGQFRSGMRRFTVGIGEAGIGMGKAKEAFKSLGVEIKDSNGKVKPTNDLLLELSEKFKDIKDATTKARIANDLFGRAGERMANFLAQGAKVIKGAKEEAQDLGLVIANEGLKDAEVFTDAMARLMGVIGGIKNAIGVALLPVMSKAIKAFRVWFVENRPEIVETLNKAIAAIVATLKILVKLLAFAVKILLKVADVVGGFENLAIAIISVVAAMKLFTIISMIITWIKIIKSAVLISKLWTVAQWLLNAALLANPIILIVVGIIALIGVIILMVKNWDKVKAAFIKFFKVVMSGVKKLGKFLMGIWSKVVNFFKRMWNNFVNWLKTTWNKIKNFFKNNIEEIIDIILILTAVLIPIVGIPVLIIRKWKPIVAFFRGLWESVKKFIPFLGGSDITATQNENKTTTNTPIESIAKSSMVPKNNIQQNSLNVNSTVSVAVPPGTAETQKKFVEKAAKKAVKQEWEKNLRNLNVNNAMVE